MGVQLSVFFCIVKRLNFLLHAKGESESLLSFFLLSLEEKYIN